MTRPATRIGVLSLMVFALVAALFVEPFWMGIFFQHITAPLGAGVGDSFLRWFMVPGIDVDGALPIPAWNGDWLWFLDPFVGLFF